VFRLLERLPSDRQRDLPDKAGENEHAAQAVALALIRQEQATEADERGERHSDLTSSVHVLFPQSYPPINVAGDDCFLSLLEAFVFGRRRLGEKREQSKNKIEPRINFRPKDAPALRCRQAGSSFAASVTQITASPGYPC
jgi:hypothetical protein